MTSQIMNEIFNKRLDLFVNLCHARGHKPTSVLLVSTMWYDGGENVGTTETYEKMLEVEEHFQMASSSAIHLIPYSVRFDDQISACDTIDLGYDAYNRRRGGNWGGIGGELKINLI